MYQSFLIGRYYAQQLTPESTDRAIDLYQQVLAADPKFAPAYAQLAYARLNQGFVHDLPSADVAAQMEPLIASALRLDDRLSAAYAVRGALRAAQSRTKEGLDDLQLAISLNPSDNFDFYWTRATLFLSVGLAASARTAIERGRSATKNEDDANTALVRVVYCEGGEAALRKYLASAGLDQSPHSIALFERLTRGCCWAMRRPPKS